MGNRKTILIVEDRKDWIDALLAYVTKLVTDRHIDCDIAVTTTEADTMARLDEYERTDTRLLLICDNHIQESDGELFIANKIASRWSKEYTPWRRQTPIVIYTVTNPKKAAKLLNADLVNKVPEVGDMGVDQLEETILAGLAKLS